MQGYSDVIQIDKELHCRFRILGKNLINSTILLSCSNLQEHKIGRLCFTFVTIPCSYYK